MILSLIFFSTAVCPVPSVLQVTTRRETHTRMRSIRSLPMLMRRSGCLYILLSTLRHMRHDLVQLSVNQFLLPATNNNTMATLTGVKALFSSEVPTLLCVFFRLLFRIITYIILTLFDYSVCGMRATVCSLKGQWEWQPSIERNFQLSSNWINGNLFVKLAGRVWHSGIH